MGLDMYLERRTYVKNWKHEEREEHTEVSAKGKKAEGVDFESVKYIVEEVAYWRKANQIHNWFIENCANGDNDKTDMYVTREQLDELLSTCKKVLESCKLVKGKIKNGQRSTPNGWEDIMEDGEYIEDSTLAEELLPTTSGFFFGSTDYDQYYLADLKHTIEVLEKLAARIPANEDRADYSYIASW